MRLTRVLIGIAAAVSLCLLLAAGPAGAKTVYQYEYSGEFFDGTGSTKGPFIGTLGGIDYDPASETLHLGVPSTPGAIAKFSKTGTPMNYSALNGGAGRDFIELTGNGSGNEVSVDKSNAASAGNVYVQRGGTVFGYHPNGLPISPAFDNENTGLPGVNIFGGSGNDAGPNGEFFTFSDGNGTSLMTQRDLDTFDPIVTYMGEVQFSDPEFDELKIDSQRNFYGIEQPGGFSQGEYVLKSPPNRSPKTSVEPEREWQYRLNASCCGAIETSQTNNRGNIAIDRSNDEVFVQRTKQPPVPRHYSTSRSTIRRAACCQRFGRRRTGYEGLASPGGITVDPATHDVYVTNNREYAGEVRHVEKFVRGRIVHRAGHRHRRGDAARRIRRGQTPRRRQPRRRRNDRLLVRIRRNRGSGQHHALQRGPGFSGSSDIAVTANLGRAGKRGQVLVQAVRGQRQRNHLRRRHRTVHRAGPADRRRPLRRQRQHRRLPGQRRPSIRTEDGPATTGNRGRRRIRFQPPGQRGSAGRKSDLGEAKSPASRTEPFDVTELVTGLRTGAPRSLPPG